MPHESRKINVYYKFNVRVKFVHHVHIWPFDHSYLDRELFMIIWKQVNFSHINCVMLYEGQVKYQIWKTRFCKSSEKYNRHDLEGFRWIFSNVCSIRGKYLKRITLTKSQPSHVGATGFLGWKPKDRWLEEQKGISDTSWKKKYNTCIGKTLR